MIRLDRSATTTLAVCLDPTCGWRGLGGTDDQARALGVTHETMCHPDRHQFRHATSQWHGIRRT